MEDVNEFYRVAFTIEYENAETSYLKAVWCDDLYSEQIEKESHDDDFLNFSYTFGKGDNSTKRWICPNITSEIDFVSANTAKSRSSDDGLLKAKALTAKVMMCDKAWGSAYVEDLSCQEIPKSNAVTFSFDFRSV